MVPREAQGKRGSFQNFRGPPWSGDLINRTDLLSPIHTADADETKLSSLVASAVCTRFATSWRQFRRVVGVNTPVGSRELCHGRWLRCAFASPNPSAVVANSCTHRRRRRDETRQFRLVGVGCVYWALGQSVVSTSFGPTVAEIDCSDDAVVSSSLVSGVSAAVHRLSCCATSIHCIRQVCCSCLNLPTSFIAYKFKPQVSFYAQNR